MSTVIVTNEGAERIARMLCGDNTTPLAVYGRLFTDITSFDPIQTLGDFPVVTRSGYTDTSFGDLTFSGITVGGVSTWTADSVTITLGDDGPSSSITITGYVVYDDAETVSLWVGDKGFPKEIPDAGAAIVINWRTVAKLGV